MGCSTPGFPVLHYFPEFAPTPVHCVDNAIQPSNPLSAPFSCTQFFPPRGSFTVSQLLASSGQNIGASASASVLPMNIQGWFPLGLTGLISMLSKGLSRVLLQHNWKASILWRTTFFMVQLAHLYMTIGKTIALTIWTFVGKMSLLFNMLSRLPWSLSC